MGEDPMTVGPMFLGTVVIDEQAFSITKIELSNGRFVITASGTGRAAYHATERDQVDMNVFGPDGQLVFTHRGPAPGRWIPGAAVLIQLPVELADHMSEEYRATLTAKVS